MIVLVMGVSGSGKTTVGRMLARALGYRFSDGDDFHSRANVDKMARGESLDDADREPWLAALAAAIDVWLHDDADVVLACSALTQCYRARLMRDPSRMKIVYLKVSLATAVARVGQRVGHFMPGKLVESQFEALEEPSGAIVVDASHIPNFIVRTICDAL